jgi:ABC-2 type transport system ATP-binding protein
MYSIETHNLCKNFPLLKTYSDIVLHPFTKRETVALRNINLKVKQGELFGLLGTNGAGKTTLLKILCTLVLPSSGCALVQGLDVKKQEKKVKRLIGYVISDERSFYWRLTGKQNLLFFAQLNNIPREKIDYLLESVGLSELDANKWFKDYSTGMRKKLAIARGLLTDPDILIMDEPANGLDPLAAMRLQTLIREQLVEKQHKTVIMATHDLQQVEAICDRIAILHKGEVKASGKVGDFNLMEILSNG